MTEPHPGGKMNNNEWFTAGPTPELVGQSRIVTLNKLKVGFEQVISDELAGGNVEWMHDHLLGAMRLSIRGFLYGRKAEHREYQWPADWWQAFKERWFPLWAKARWPVQYERRVVDVMEIYPTYKPALPPDMHQFRLVLMEDIGGS